MSSNDKEVSFPMLILGVSIMLVAIYIWEAFPDDYIFKITGMLLLIVGAYLCLKARKQI